MELTDIYLFRWNWWTFIVFLLILAIWLWRVDKDMKERGKGGLFTLEGWW